MLAFFSHVCRCRYQDLVTTHPTRQLQVSSYFFLCTKNILTTPSHPPSHPPLHHNQNDKYIRNIKDTDCDRNIVTTSKYTCHYPSTTTAILTQYLKANLQTASFHLSLNSPRPQPRHQEHPTTSPWPTHSPPVTSTTSAELTVTTSVPGQTKALSFSRRTPRSSSWTWI